MDLQLILVVETNKDVMSDWIYIKECIEHFYTFDQAHVRLKPVFMDGKGKYKSKKREIETLKKQYNSVSDSRRTEIIYCFDCDDYDSKPEDAEFLARVKQYCSTNGYEFVWFCKDVERVFLGRKVDDSKKKDESARFKKKGLISEVHENNLKVERYSNNSSNLMRVLDKFLKTDKE